MARLLKAPSSSRRQEARELDVPTDDFYHPSSTLETLLTIVNNALIAQLDEPDRSRLLDSAKEVPLARLQVLRQPGQPLTHVYFPIRGFACLVAMDSAPVGLEVAMVGREGMLGVQGVLSCETTPFRAVVQGEGRAWWVTVDVLRRHFELHLATKALLDGYGTFRLNQLANLAQCLYQHEVGPRLAR